MSTCNWEEGRNLASKALTTTLANSDTAHPPYAPVQHSFSHTIRQYVTVLKILLAEYRTSWIFHVFFGMLLPIGFIFFLKTASGEMTQERAIFLLGGNMAMSISFGPTSLLLIKIGWWQQSKEFHYWAALPLPKLTLVLALVTVALVLALPGLAGVYLFGSLVLGLPFAGSLALIPVVLLSALSLVGFGALVGSYVRDGQTANIVANMLIIIVGFLSPTMIPAKSLPAPLRYLSFLIPTTYAADAFRAVLNGRLGTNFVIDMVVLSIVAIGFLFLVHRKVDWRSV